MMRTLSITAAALVSGLLFLPATATASTHTIGAHQDVQPVSGSSPIGVLGECSLGGRVCGHIYNDDNNQSLRITTDWGNYEDPATWRTLWPGQNSDSIGVKDADGFMIPNGCRGTIAFVRDVGPGWYKVRDSQHIHLTDIAC